VSEAGKVRVRGDDVCLVTKQAARYLHASPRTLERWRVDGDGPPYFKLGPGLRAKVLYRLSDLDAWLARFRYNSTSEYRARQGEGDA
jgi:helix-turn-helix protein